LHQEQNYFSEEERLILNILKMGELQSADIYSMFLTRAKSSKRQIRNYLASLVEKGIIEFNELETVSPLKPKIYRLKKGGGIMGLINKSEIKKLIRTKGLRLSEEIYEALDAKIRDIIEIGCDRSIQNKRKTLFNFDL
jgi:hypothetical protein